MNYQQPFAFVARHCVVIDTKKKTIKCRHGSKCWAIGCKYEHPTCHYGTKCYARSCTRYHGPFTKEQWVKKREENRLVYMKKGGNKKQHRIVNPGNYLGLSSQIKDRPIPGIGIMPPPFTGNGGVAQHKWACQFGQYCVCCMKRHPPGHNTFG